MTDKINPAELFHGISRFLCKAAFLYMKLIKYAVRNTHF